MNKSILVVVAVLIILALGGFLFMNNKSTNTGSQVSPTKSTPQENTTKKTNEQKSLKDLFSLGVAQECSYKDEMGNGGVVYMTNGKMRGDFSSVTKDQTIKSHMVTDGKTSYIWMDNQAMGFKMSMEAAGQTSPDKINTQGSVDINKKGNFSCKPWVVSSSLFELPSNIKFTDLSDLQKSPSTSEGSQGGVQDMKAAQCAACDSVPQEARAQCKASLGCN